MSELRQRGFMVTDGPFSGNEIVNIAKDYDHSFAATPVAQIKRGRTSTGWGGLVALEPFCRIYLHPPLLSAATERIGGPIKLSSFCARTLLSNAAADPPHQDVAPGVDGYPLVGFIFMVDEFRLENGDAVHSRFTGWTAAASPYPCVRRLWPGGFDAHI